MSDIVDRLQAKLDACQEQLQYAEDMQAVLDSEAAKKVSDARDVVEELLEWRERVAMLSAKKETLGMILIT
ncbi:MAG: hypothetical protein F4W68_04900 [Cenarchaeum sp. SB0661_bin_35]|nr:hypothetical protein [Cenarchaeum sp. SB0662_bin_33]MYC79816.1 hypothetical protein [Cenarchaeum sp. SB0661_bin_35]